MNEPNWIDREDCLVFHSGLLARFGGLAGLRDEGLLESAWRGHSNFWPTGIPIYLISRLLTRTGS